MAFIWLQIHQFPHDITNVTKLIFSFNLNSWHFNNNSYLAWPAIQIDCLVIFYREFCMQVDKKISTVLI